MTQSSTGSTTGDWLVLFHNRECIDCQRISAVWETGWLLEVISLTIVYILCNLTKVFTSNPFFESVGAVLRNRVNVARVDKDIRGIKTAKRFNVQKAPEFIL